MQFILSHWHCILPVAGIAIAMIFMRGKPKKENMSEEARRKKTSAKADNNSQY